MTSNIEFKKINNCRICASTELTSIVDFGNQPLANALKNNYSNDTEYPLELVFCCDCSCLQLRFEIPQNQLFDNYIWVTGTSTLAQKEALNWAEKIVNLSGSGANKLAYEIASNDDTFLKPLSVAGYKTVGVDPAKNLENFHTDPRINHEYFYFSDNVADFLVDKYGKADVLIARNVVAHVPDPTNFVKGISRLLDEFGIAIVEFHYSGKILKELQYDSIYHEHISYFSLTTFQRIISRFNLEIFRVEQGPISGGSLVVYFKHVTNKLVNVENSVQKFKEQEVTDGINSIEEWQNFGLKVKHHKDNLTEFLLNCKNQDKKIVFYGASARSSTLLNYTQLNLDWTLGFIDSNPLKFNLITPGTNLMIRSLEDFNTIYKNVDIVIITAWNFKEEILSRLQEFYSQTDVFIPLPNSLKKLTK